jgi:quercetin dioxygenase-like cupin family protein
MQTETITRTKIYTNENGDSCFTELPPLTATPNHAHNQDLLTENIPAKSIRFHEYKSGHYEDWHTPHLGKIIIVFLTGEQAIECSLGEKKIFTAGDVLYVEDTIGKGHRTYGLKDGSSLIIAL